MNKLTREIISRTTLAVIALAMLYGAIACFGASSRWKREWREKHPDPMSVGRRDLSGAGYPLIAGLLLLPTGLFLLTVAVVPSDWLLRIFRLHTTLHENPSADNPRGPWR